MFDWLGPVIGIVGPILIGIWVLGRFFSKGKKT